MTSRNINMGNSSKLEFITQYLNIINPFNKLAPGELSVLSYIMNSEYSMLEEKIREDMLLSPKVKEKIRFALNISDARLNNIISSLRKKGVLIRVGGGNTFHEVYDIRDLTLPCSITFTWDEKGSV